MEATVCGSPAQMKLLLILFLQHEIVLHKEEHRHVQGWGTLKAACTYYRCHPHPTPPPIISLFILIRMRIKTAFMFLFFSARVHAEQLDAVRVPVEADSRAEDQGPDVGDEEVLRLVFLHILKLELGKLLFTHTQTGKKKKKRLKLRQCFIICYVRE